QTYPALSTGYSLPMVAAFAAAQGADLLLQSGGTGPMLVSAAMQELWQAPRIEAMNTMAGTRVVCNGSALFVTPAVQSPTLRAYDGPTGALIGEVALAGGNLFLSVTAAQNAGVTPGWLSNASSVAAHGNQGPLVLVGSTDGYLYALDPCSMTLIWA